MRCPACKIVLDNTKVRWGEPFKCERCGTSLQVSRQYLRVIAGLSVPLGLGLLWVLHVRGLSLYLLWLPITVVLYVTLVQLGSRVLRPALHRYESDTTTTLDL
jgi:uncharacterized paraquat-inducible protein A